MFTMPDGRVLGRVEMQNDLRRAALLAGLSDVNTSTHSLRVSCATWLYQAGYDLEYTKHHGRWASNVVHVYLLEGSGFHTMCKKMSECNKFSCCTRDVRTGSLPLSLAPSGCCGRQRLHSPWSGSNIEL